MLDVIVSWVWPIVFGVISVYLIHGWHERRNGEREDLRALEREVQALKYEFWDSLTHAQRAEITERRDA